MPLDNDPKTAYTTLITKSSYLAGVIILAYSLKKHGAKYPLIVLYTPNLENTPALRALALEAPYTNLILKKTEQLLPTGKTKLIAERFADTWTKLRVFELYEDGWERVCYLDADMMIMKNMDTIFDNFPAKDHIAATHVCCCNKDHDAWAPASWTPENCAFSLVKHPEALTHPTPVSSQPETHALLNGGMFLFSPSQELWDQMLHHFNTSTTIKEMMFPDQDFLAEFFRGKWESRGWQYNALKTMRYWHENIWRDDEVRCLHYIVDKPWVKRVGEDGIAGYLGRDGETHSWWWTEWERWTEERKREGETEVVDILRKFVARPPGEEGEEDEEMRAIGSNVQGMANGHKKEEGNAKETSGDKEEDENSKAPGIEDIVNPAPGFKATKRGLMERGHGPVVHSK